MSRLARAVLPAILCLPVAAQNFTQRGFLETDLTLYPQTAPNDSSLAIDANLFRYEASYKALPWLRFAGSFDARFDTHQEVERTAHLDWQDRSLERPALSLREFNATITKDKLTAEFGKQFIRWGKADILNPTDRFAPRDFLTVTDPDFLAVYPYVTTIRGTKFRCRGGNPEELSKRLSSLFTKLVGKEVKAAKVV